MTKSGNKVANNIKVATKLEDTLISKENIELSKFDQFADAIRNKDGYIAISYYQTIPKVVRVHGTDYAFVVQHNVCLSWVKVEDVQAFLDLIGGCCGNLHPGVFRLANQNNVNVWLTGDR